MMQEAASQVRNEVYSAMREVHRFNATAPRGKSRKMPSKIDLKKQLKDSPCAVAVGRAKQVQYAIDDAWAMFASYRSNFFDWAKDHSSRQGKPRPPSYYRLGKRSRLRVDYQDIKIENGRLCLPDSLGLESVALCDHRGMPLFAADERIAEVRIEPCRSRQYVHLDLVIKKITGNKVGKHTKQPKLEDLGRSGYLLLDTGVTRLLTVLDEKNLVSFFIYGSVAKAILARGAKWHAKLKSEAALGVKHGKSRAAALAARSARQMDDLIKKVARLMVEYAIAHHLAHVVVGRNKEWKQFVNMGSRQNQLFTFIPHAKLVAALQAQCARAGIQFSETEESFTSKIDHLAAEPMGPKPDNYKWLGSRNPRGCFRSSVGVVLHADVNGCIGIGRKVGGEQWLQDFLRRLGASPGTRLVPRKVYMNGMGRGWNLDSGLPRGMSPRMWISTKVALAQAGLMPRSNAVASVYVYHATSIPHDPDSNPDSKAA